MREGVLEDAWKLSSCADLDRGEAELLHLKGLTRLARPKANSATTIAPNQESKSMVAVYDPVAVTLEGLRIF